ncbi:hypothetical protein JX265_000851 [Neoarthrinium moseri]|uniref:Peroxisomal biogenesis factor 11 n=1 Tax=Neoarthrinium moseri TaxID=1658444 RepID=A0A9P9WX06_9PEZI|nr:uncharacterized protein JN550_007043 [Neoarthrinium moseri]KAI1867312.1 hypothetical protein JN550_007043 [Neoarthrinium moseri]KAI1880611.1 hypothetical protein JX265_000851 [Neoarthrinium moseri]
MSVQFHEQFIRFTTDSVGLERTFRLLQATVQIIASYPAVLGLLLSLLGFITGSSSAAVSHAQTNVILLALRQRLGLARRFFRLFRFLDAFHAAHKLYAGLSATGAAPAPAEAWLDVLGRTFNGMYLLLEASTIVDALQIEGLRVWAPDWERAITVEAQRFWLLALVCGVLAGLLRMVKVLAYTPVPATGDGFAHGAKEGKDDAGEKDKVGPGDGDEGEFDMQKEQQRLRAIVKERRKGRVLWRREVRAKLRGLGRAVTANALDIVLPGSVVGWVQADPGTVGLAMFVTSILTGMDAWERCGREVAASK